MISCSPGRRAGFSFFFREAGRSTLMMAADRSILTCRAILFLFVVIGIPSVVRSSTLEDSAKELARKIAAALPARENVYCEIRNISSLQLVDVARIEQAFKSELQERGFHITSSGATITVAVTLSENFKNFVWSGEIRQGDASQVYLMPVKRSSGNRAVSTAMPVTIHSEKFWEGPERILDAGEISNGVGKSWLVLLLPDGLRVQDKQTGPVSTIEITSAQSSTRDPWGNLSIESIGSAIGFFLAPRVCTLNLETLELDGCNATEVPAGGPPVSRIPVMFDVAPAGPPPPGKGTVIEMKAVCGGANQFLATGPRDYTQTDSLQVFQRESTGAVAASTELDFAGPITALHARSDTPRVIVRNLATGNYEAYRLSFSCGQ